MSAASRPLRPEIRVASTWTTSSGPRCIPNYIPWGVSVFARNGQVKDDHDRFKFAARCILHDLRWVPSAVMSASRSIYVKENCYCLAKND